MPMPSDGNDKEFELIAASKFFFEVNGIELPILSVGNISGKQDAAGANKSTGAGKGGALTWMKTTTQTQGGTISIQCPATKASKDLADYFNAVVRTTNDKSDNKVVPASVTGYNAAGEAVLKWEYRDVMITSYSGPSFDATSSDFCKEKFEFVCTEIRRIKL